MILNARLIGAGEEQIDATQLERSFRVAADKRPLFVPAGEVLAGFADVSSIVNWNKYSGEIIGQFANFRDWRCVRREIEVLAKAIAGNDFANFNNLSTAEKVVACWWLPDLIPTADFVATIPIAADRSAILLNYQTRSLESHQLRYSAVQIVAFSNFNTADRLESVIEIIDDALLLKYYAGIESLATDGYNGLINYIDSTAGSDYEGVGLRSKLYTPIGALSLSQICDLMIGILRDGLY